MTRPTVLVYHADPRYAELMRVPKRGALVRTAATPREAAEPIAEADILYAWKFPPQLYAKAGRLKWLQVMGAGVDWALVPELPAGVQVVLCAAAPDTPEIEERLKRALPTHPNVVWIGEMIPTKEVVQLYSHAAVFVCPSVYEPFGLINLEAMACETAVVASAVGGILEVVEDGTTGLLVEPGHPEALAAAIRGLLDDPGRRRAMGQAGRRRVEAHFSWASVAARTREVYEAAKVEFARSAET